jgi:hypothetical protein
MKETGPLEIPPLEAMRSARGRSREKEKPVPPPVCRISAASRRVEKIPFIESSIGRTKQAASCPCSLPAFIRVGELGRNRSAESSSKNRSSHAAESPPKIFSAAATVRATRRNISVGVSTTRPAASLRR